MTETYNIDLFDGHLIFANNGLKVLVDTGSPFSIGKDPHFEFMGQQYHCNEGISTISEMMGYDIDVLMGMDVLKMMGIYGAIGFDLFNAFTILLDLRNNELLLAEIHNKKA